MATTYGTSDFRKGLRVEFDGDPYLVVECEFRKPGKGSAIYTLKAVSYTHLTLPTKA